MPDNVPKTTKIIIPLAGIAAGTQQPRAVYNAVSQQVLSAIGPTTSQRASHVDAGKDMGQAALKVLAYSGDDFAFRTGDDQPYQISPRYAEWWFADMTPTGHDVVLGPYPVASRDVALEDEVQWLHNHNIPVCMPCIEKQTGVPCIDESGYTGEVYAIRSVVAPAVRTRTLPVPQRLVPNLQTTNVDATKLLAGLPHIDADYSAVETKVLSHYRREVADALRTRILSGHDDVEGANGWEEAGDVLSCTVFREDHNSTEANSPSVAWAFSVTFDPVQCSVADISFGRV